ncbi:transposase, MuDR, MULE transposase domain protein [Tanacetum coccineum]
MSIQPDAYHKLCEAGPQRWSRAHCPLVRYNYLTSNSVESVNACTVLYRKLPVLKLAETYRAMVQDWYFKRRNLTDDRYNREVDFQKRTCHCRKWQLSGIPCGHVLAVTRFLGLTDCVEFVEDWFKKEKYQGTYTESINFVGNIKEWEFPQHIQKAIPPRMDNPQPDRPKNTNRIQSQGEEPRVIHYSRCHQAGHIPDQCNQPFVLQPPVNTSRQNDQQTPINEQPSFYNPHQQYDNTFQSYNQHSSQPYNETTYPYDQHHTNTSQPYEGNHTQSAQMYEQYDSQEHPSQHLDNLNTNGSNIHIMTFKVLLHHYGRFTSSPGRNFIDGMVATIDPVELDNFSTNQVKFILTNSLGYDENSSTFLYLKKPNCSLDSGVVPLADAI